MKSIFSILKVLLPLAFGVFLIWYVFKDLTVQEKDDLYFSFSHANYFWISISVLFGILSHVSRAFRWKYSIEPLGKTPKFLNSFFTVMIGYVANLALPRLGEVTRPGLLAKYEDLPFQKLFGTIVAERVADLLVLSLIMASIVFIEFDMIRDMLTNYLNTGSGNISTGKIVSLLIIALIGISAFLFLMKSKSQNTLLVKIREFIRGILEGVQSIMKMEKKLYFLLHTVFIWVMYIGMFWLCFYSIEETSTASFGAILASFVMGSLAIVFVQGGLGVFPIAIMETLMLYGFSKTSALALGWILWTSQTLMVIVLGVISLMLIRIYNKKRNHAVS
ncbi:MAG: UPF0104 family protein [Bacteroidetes bacterium]|nr:MAG: UPF0104 family protein [Bacteroidota bacterium]MBL1143813.1 UPF0104 family protein [Bacteroidota bacterium]NOG56614.1 flippase-like domain-containing protein [Bacteroidota bacterium]